MSGMIGADPDALDRLAADFDRSAGTLESHATRVSALVHANPWAGARAIRFRNDWDQRHVPQLRRTATALRTAAKQLRLQAQEQRRASSAGGVSGVGGWGSGFGGFRPGGSMPVPGRFGPDLLTPTSTFEPWNLLKDRFLLEFGALGLLGATAALGNNANLIGRYPKGIIGDLARSNDFFKYKRGLNGIFSVNGLGQKVDNIPGLGKLGSKIGGLDLMAASAGFATNPTPLGASETVAAGLKMSKHPVAYLGGMALSSINMAAAEAQKTDWSPEALKSTADYVKTAGPGVVVEEFGKAAVEVFTKRIWDIF